MQGEPMYRRNWKGIYRLPDNLANQNRLHAWLRSGSANAIVEYGGWLRGADGEILPGLWITVWQGRTRKKNRPFCGAKTRAGGACQAKAVPNKTRCRMHGGMSTGPKTAAGRAAIADSNRRRGAVLDKEN